MTVRSAWFDLRLSLVLATSSIIASTLPAIAQMPGHTQEAPPRSAVSRQLPSAVIAARAGAGSGRPPAVVLLPPEDRTASPDTKTGHTPGNARPHAHEGRHFTFRLPGPGDGGADRAHPVGQSSLQSELPQPNYWIVSSRKLPQELPWAGSQPLEVFERLPDGTLLTSNVPLMAGQMTPSAPVCIFIHGTFVSAELHQKESARTYAWVREAAPHLPLNVIFFTWPSDTDSLLRSPLLVNQRGRWAENNAFYLVNLISQLPGECPVCLIGHSHGARCVAATLHLAGGGQLGGLYAPCDVGAMRRFRAVLAAAAFDRHWLNPGQQYERALCRAEGILNLRNHGDMALHFYPMRQLFSRQAIGATGFTLWDRARLGPLNGRAIDLDVSPLIGLGHTWPHFYNERWIARAIVPYVYFVDVAGVRIGSDIGIHE